LLVTQWHIERKFDRIHPSNTFQRKTGYSRIGGILVFSTALENLILQTLLMWTIRK